MKANAPEKIYIPRTNMEVEGHLEEFWVDHKTFDDDVDYIRTDAFIEKADKFISSFFHPDDTELKNIILDEFHKYIKE